MSSLFITSLIENLEGYGAGRTVAHKEFGWSWANHRVTLHSASSDCTVLPSWAAEGLLSTTQHRSGTLWFDSHEMGIVPRLHEIPTVCMQGATVNSSISCLLNNGASATFQEVLGGNL